jgi:tetratricopeptide (TPR) repeat protein
MKWAVYLACGLAGGVGGALLALALRPEPTPSRVAVEKVAPDPEALRAQEERDGVQERRLAELERQLAERAVVAGGKPAAAPARPEAPEGEGPREGAAPKSEGITDVPDVIRWLKGRKAGPEETERLFAWLTNNKERIPAAIAAILKEVEADPTNPELQVALATAYVAELVNTTTPGPQQGMVWTRAAAAYDAAIKLDPEHWTARHGKAFGTSMMPEFLGQRPEAIRQFEELLEIQKRHAPEPHYASTYFRLGTLYKDAGNLEKARETWTAGLALFPDNDEIKGALEASTKR